MNDTTLSVSGDNRGIIAGRDIQDANLVSTGDVAGSYNAIGVGAQVVINQLRQARSAVDEQAAKIRLAEAQLADAVARKVQQLTAALDKAARLDRRNPYRSLLDYRLEDAPYFYGRDDAIAALLGKIHDHRFTVLHSDSGAGKSSLLQAGLMARLLAAGHLPLRLRPYGDEPAHFIKQSFLSNLDGAPEVARFQQMPLAGFLRAVTGCLGDSTLYLFLDQFEEFFTELPFEAQERFADELANCLDDGLDVRWVIALRKEYFSDLSRFHPRIAPFENEYFLAAFQQEEARAVVVEPAHKQGVEYESEDLVNTVLADLREADGRLQPPQVQLVCYELFEDALASATPNLITLALYSQPRGRGRPGAQGILGNHLARVLERMPAGERKLARRSLEALVSSQSRRIRLDHDDLVAYVAQRDPALNATQLDSVLNQLIDSRLVRSDEDENDEPVYELAHDFLLSEVELDPALLAQKAAQELLRQEVETYQRFGTLLSKQKHAIIDSQRAALHMDDASRALLAQSEVAIHAEEQAQEASRQRVLQRTRLALAGALFALVFAAIAAYPTASNLLRRKAALDLGKLMPIAGSEAILGNDELHKSGNAFPEDIYDLDGYMIEETEVSVQRYLLCVESKACSPPNTDPAQYMAAERAKYPITGVTAYQADVFCAWLGMRLPTALEWERAARNIHGDPWPWGKEPPKDPTQAVLAYDFPEPAPVQPVGMAKAGVSAEGVFDLVGNVWEWTGTHPDSESVDRLIIKGGSAENSVAVVPTMAWNEDASSNYHARDVGFRCALSS
jgi:formylglycine-generating enzyme required for sulfatase activity